MVLSCAERSNGIEHNAYKVLCGWFDMRFVLVLVVIALIVASCSGNESEPQDNAVEPGDGVVVEEPQVPQEQSPDVILDVRAGNFWFEIDGERGAPVVVSRGDRVRIVFTSVSGIHSFVVDDLSVEVGPVSSELEDPTVTFDFVAERSGTFEFYDRVGRNRERGMVGTFTVR